MLRSCIIGIIKRGQVEWSWFDIKTFRTRFYFYVNFFHRIFLPLASSRILARLIFFSPCLLVWYYTACTDETIIILRRRSLRIPAIYQVRILHIPACCSTTLSHNVSTCFRLFVEQKSGNISGQSGAYIYFCTRHVFYSTGLTAQGRCCRRAVHIVPSVISVETQHKNTSCRAAFCRRGRTQQHLFSVYLRIRSSGIQSVTYQEKAFPSVFAVFVCVRRVLTARRHPAQPMSAAILQSYYGEIQVLCYSSTSSFLMLGSKQCRK